MPINGVQASAGMKPATPTIGTATDGGTGTTVSVAFTPSSYIGKGTITYTATSNPGSITATGSGSPITVSSLTAGTAYTFTVKGDTNYGVASDTSSASNSVTPAVPTSFDSIATFTPTGSANTYTFSSIPSTYKSLQIRVSKLNGIAIAVRMNGDTGANYSSHILYAYGDNSGSNPLTTYASGLATPTSIRVGVFSNTVITAPYVSIIDIIDYASTSKNKTLRAISGFDANNVNEEVGLASGVWHSTTAVNSITIFSTSGSNWGPGSSIALYGVK